MRINFKNVWAFAQCERRLTTRTSRYWSAVITSFLIALASMFIKTVWYTFGSSVSASLSLMSPRFNFADSGSWFLMIFMAGLVFFAADIRARDQRDRIHEVLDARDYSNLDLLFGRFIGMLMAAWLPMLMLTIILQVVALILALSGSPFGQPVEFVTLFSFPFFNALPAMAFACALVILISLIIKPHFLALTVSMGLLGALYWLSLGSFPFAVSSSLDLLGTYQNTFGSDWMSAVVHDGFGYLQRLSLILFAVGFLFIAAKVHPRIDSSVSTATVATGFAGFAAGALLVVLIFTGRQQVIDDGQQWLAAHQAKQSNVAPDVKKVTGSIVIEPGQQLKSQLQITVTAPSGERLQQALFALNPAYSIDKVTDSSGANIDYSFDNGLLELQLPSAITAGQTVSFDLHYHGKPDALFGYLDSRLNPRSLSSEDATAFMLGIENGLFDKRYVALMPGNFWLPMSGVDSAEKRPDHFQLALDVKVPEGWLVAGPGQRQDKGSGTFSYQPKVEIAEVALMAAPFKSYATNIEGIDFELLLHPDHTTNVEVLAEGEAQVKQWLESRLSLLKDAGLHYPFGGFSLVEVPNALRGYAGGWRNDTVMAPPAMVLMKESAFPSARFDFDSVASLGRGWPQKDLENGQGLIVVKRLHEFFSNDFLGGNLFAGFARSIFHHQLSADGGDALALDYTMHQLTTLVVSDQQDYFFPSRLSDVFRLMANTMDTSSERGSTVSRRMIDSFATDQFVWNAVSQTPLNGLDKLDDAGLAADLLALKAGGMAQMIYQVLGPDNAGRLVAYMLAQHPNGDYNRESLVKGVAAFDRNLSAMIESWYVSKGLAGFTVADSQLLQLPGSNAGDTRYQLKMTISNRENVAGYVRIAWKTKEDEQHALSEPFYVGANSDVEYGLVLSQIPLEVYLKPYVSLNRQQYLVKRFVPQDVKLTNMVAFSGVRELEQPLNQLQRVVIDDLSGGFNINSNQQNDSMRLTADGANLERGMNIDQGLPVSMSWDARQWSRRSLDSAYGKYRRTLVYMAAGQGNAEISLKGNLPNAGKWRLEIHLPDVPPIRQKKLGDLSLQLVVNGQRTPLTFDSNNATLGWNSLGDFDLPKGEVEVLLSDKTTGEMVIFDAIAFNGKVTNMAQAAAPVNH